MIGRAEASIDNDPLPVRTCVRVWGRLGRTTAPVGAPTSRRERRSFVILENRNVERGWRARYGCAGCAERS